jgi:acetyltransferase
MPAFDTRPGVAGELKMDAADRIDTILNPRSVAVIGASGEPGKRGYRALKILMEDGYQGRIHPVNPRESEILGLPCHASVLDIDEPVDVALVCTPAKHLPAVLEECGRKGVKGAIVVSGGFSEAGEEGLQLELQSVAIARRHGVRLIGPNMNGIFSRRHSCNLSPWREVPPGEIAVLSNSANVVHWLLTKAWARGSVGFSTMLSVGNQADVQFHELIDGLGKDAQTRAIVVYAEGFRDGRALIEVAARVSQTTPIVMYKAGRNGEGARMARSHSGSLAGDHAVSSGALQQAGVTLVTRAEYLLPVAEALGNLPRMRSRNVAVISEGGGPITIVSEALSELALNLAPLSADTQATIHAVIPESTVIANPVDIAVLTNPSVRNYGLCAQAILQDPGIDALLFVGWFGAYGRRGGPAVAAEEQEVARMLGRMMRETGKPVIVQSHYAQVGTEALDILRASGVPVHQDFDIAVQCVVAAARHGEASRRLALGLPSAAPLRAPVAVSLIDECRAARRGSLLEHEGRRVLEAHGIPIPVHRLAGNRQELAGVMPAFGESPLALKIVSPDIVHKSDADCVRLGVRGEAQATAALAEILANASAFAPDARIAGVLVSPMAERGVEVIVGTSHDPQFGPVIMFGLGGVFVEVMRDVAFRTLPLSVEDARAMIDDIRGRQVFAGVRGLPAVDMPALTGLLMAVSGIALAYPEIAEIDLNPVILHAHGFSIVDVRMILAD